MATWWKRAMGKVGRALLREAYGGFGSFGYDSIDGDTGYRRLSGSPKDLAPQKQDKVLQLAYYLWRSNPLARRFIELDVNFVVGDGFTVTSEIEEVQEVIDKHWDDPINRWDIRIFPRVRELAMDGELCWPAFVNEVTGLVRLGYLDPRAITRVEPDPENVSIPVLVVTGDNAGGERKYKVIQQGDPADLLSAKGFALWNTGTQGECFYYRINDVSNATRGSSDLEPTLDHLDQFDRLHFDTADRVGFLNAFIWDVTLKGSTPDDVINWIRTHGAAPKAGTVRAHGENEEWQSVTPDLQAADVSALVDMYRLYVGAGAGIPDHWLSEGQATKASATEMNDPPIKRLKARQSLWTAIIHDVISYQIRRAVEPKEGVRGPLAGKGGADAEGTVELESGAKVPIWEAFTVVPSPISMKDMTKAAAVLSEVTTACATAITDDLISREEARKLIVQVVGEFDVELDEELPEPNEPTAAEQREEAATMASLEKARGRLPVNGGGGVNGRSQQGARGAAQRRPASSGTKPPAKEE